MSDDTNYESVPYGTLAFSQTHPDRLATVARVFGLQTAPVANCRVLELGCARGSNLIPMAFHLPGSCFVGVELSHRQVAEGRAAIQALGLRNIRLEEASLVAVDRSWGEFDYIICHGVFSWVEGAVQESIFRILSQNLAPAGVAYVSYNTYPGWHLREAVRRMMLYHTRQFTDPAEQIQQARALLTFLASSAEPGTAYGQLLQEEVANVQSAEDWYLFHEHLEPTNTPLYFAEFMERAMSHGLRYLSEADLAHVLGQRFREGVADTLERISPDILHLEQYLDFVCNRRFRQTLLVHEAVTPKRALSPAVLHGMLVSSRALADGWSVDLAPGRPAVFRIGDRRLETSEPVTKAAFALLLDEAPRALPVDDLSARAIQRVLTSVDPAAPADRLHKTLMEQLFQCVIGGIVELHTFQAPFATEPGERPCVSRLAAWQAREKDIVVSALHQTVRLDELSRAIVQLADGSRTRSEIVDALVERASSGEFELHTDDGAAADPAAARAELCTIVDRLVASMARGALLVEAA